MKRVIVLGRKRPLNLLRVLINKIMNQPIGSTINFPIENRQEYSLEKITERLRNGKPIYPKEAVEIRMFLSGEYSFIAGKLEEILKLKSDMWVLIRENVKTDKGADIAWQRTDEGKNEMTFRSQLKRIEKILSALRTFLSVAEQEARNVF